MRRNTSDKHLCRRLSTFIALACSLSLVSTMTVRALDLQGHRGARGLLPENTLAAFAAAMTLGVTTLELDLGMTGDGHLVVSHDPRLNPSLTRGPDGNWIAAPGAPIRGLNLAELGAFDVGRIDPRSRYAQRFSGQQPVDGARIPALNEVFALARRAGNERIRFNIETKIDPREPRLTADPGTFANSVIASVRNAGMAHRVTVQSFDWRSLQHVQSKAPEIETAYLSVQQDWFDNIEADRRGASPWTAGLDVDAFGGSLPRMVKHAGGAVWSPYYREVDRALLEQARDLGLRVIVWTVNDAPSMDELISLGVDGIITDYPDRLRDVMLRRGLPMPKATPVSPPKQ